MYYTVILKLTKMSVFLKKLNTLICVMWSLEIMSTSVLSYFLWHEKSHTGFTCLLISFFFHISYSQAGILVDTASSFSESSNTQACNLELELVHSNTCKPEKCIPITLDTNPEPLPSLTPTATCLSCADQPYLCF